MLFEIRTEDRGAPILEWSAFPSEDEVLLAPFQGFRVREVEARAGVLCIGLETVDDHRPRAGSPPEPVLPAAGAVMRSVSFWIFVLFVSALCWVFWQGQAQQSTKI